MAKKMSIREMREAEEKRKKEQFRSRDAERKAKEEAERKVEELKSGNAATPVKDLGNNTGNEFAQNRQKHKSFSKANGLKSSHFYEDKIVLTAFGKGNEAIIEKQIESEAIRNVNDPMKFDAEFFYDGNKSFSDKLQITSTRKNKGKSLTPGVHTITQGARQDMIHAKSPLEIKFFGKEFPNDNIHIQIIYNILDIRKILAVHSSNIVIVLNNLFGNVDKDIVGGLSTRSEYENSGKKDRIVDGEARKRLGYFGKWITDLNGDDFNKHIYNIFCLIGSVRQDCTHGMMEYKNGKYTDGWLFNLDDPEMLEKSFKEELDLIYNKRFSNLKSSFKNKSGVDVAIAFNALKQCNEFADCEFTKSSVAGEFYKFTVTKNYKNMGFSIKRLREEMLTTKGSALKDSRYDSVRHRLYKAIDFIVYYYYAYVNESRAASMVDSLRAATTESEKTGIYGSECEFIWGKLGNTIMNTIAKDAVNLSKDKNQSRDCGNFDDSDVDAANVTTFSKLMYLLTNFLDGKEINDLITTLINKFDNINSLIKVLAELNDESSFTDEYKFFEKSGRVVEELRVVNSVARMSKPDETAKEPMYRDALDILGTRNHSQAEEEKIIKDLIGTYDKNGKKLSGYNGFRNFIASNVIESDRFKYLIRYCNPKTVRALALNPNVVHLAVSHLDDTMIDRYYNSCHAPYKYNARKREYLEGLVAGISYDDFEGINNRYNNDDKTAKQTIISFYLTIMYHIIKNLVYVNSRYVMAFYCGERDSKLLGSDAFDDDVTTCYCGLTKSFIDPANDHHLNSYACGYLKVNVDNLYNAEPTDERQAVSGDRIIKFFRNNVAHMNHIRHADQYIEKIGKTDSYFALYHYLMQRELEVSIRNAYEKTEKTDVGGEKVFFCPSVTIKQYLDNLETFNTYSKDFVKALCVPFGYNLARFKNLSIDELFDRNDDRKKEAEKKETEIGKKEHKYSDKHISGEPSQE